MSSIYLDVAGESDVGLVRSHNEDALLIATFGEDPLLLHGPTARPSHIALVDRADLALLMVADGVGGSAGGEIASRMAVDAVHETLHGAKDEVVRADAARHVLRDAIKRANDDLVAYAASHGFERGIATTATTVLLVGGLAHISQVGDSRAYLVREGVPHRLTKDQSLVQKLVDAGELTAEEAERSEKRNIILQAVGGTSEVEPEIGTAPIDVGDVLVLCSDGLSGLLTDAEIASSVVASATADDACHRLVGLAIERGAPDNVTVLVARIIDAAPAPKRSIPVSLKSLSAILATAVLLGLLAYYLRG